MRSIQVLGPGRCEGQSGVRARQYDGQARYEGQAG